MAEGIVSFSDFKKMDIVVGTVTSVEPHPNADKLYVLNVDLGEEEERTLVAGIKPYYTPDELQGKQLVVVKNLEPAIVRGVESQGMLLAAQHDDAPGEVVIVSPERPMKPGAKVL
jgi:methionyl-tRNA synthetase